MPMRRRAWRALHHQCFPQEPRWRFSVVSDPEQADIVLEVRRYSWFGFDTGNEQPVAFVLGWAKNANPAVDQVTWLEQYQGRWKSSDTIAGVVRTFRKSVEQAEKAGAN
jgi:hypothetical protein